MSVSVCWVIHTAVDYRQVILEFYLAYQAHGALAQADAIISLLLYTYTLHTYYKWHCRGSLCWTIGDNWIMVRTRKEAMMTNDDSTTFEALLWCSDIVLLFCSASESKYSRAMSMWADRHHNQKKLPFTEYKYRFVQQHNSQNLVHFTPACNLGHRTLYISCIVEIL